VPQVSRPAVVITKIVRGHYTKRTDRRERPSLGTSELIRLFVNENELSLRPAGQIEVRREDVARIAFAYLPSVGRLKIS
jgi:hypothetical protein